MLSRTLKEKLYQILEYCIILHFLLSIGSGSGILNVDTTDIGKSDNYCRLAYGKETSVSSCLAAACLIADGNRLEREDKGVEFNESLFERYSAWRRRPRSRHPD